MASLGNQQQSFPTVPPSLSAGDHEMRDYYTTQDAPRPTVNQAPYLTPYLGLRARLSQIWINRWTILLLLVLVRTLIAVASIDEGLGSARKQALRACTSVESMGSTMASMPHYMSRGVNEMTASGVERAVNGLMSMLSLTVTGVEEIVIFVINLLTSTYLCLIHFAVTGSLQAALKVIEKVSDFMNKTLDGVGDGIATVVDTFDDTLEDIVGAITNPFGNEKKPTIDLSKQINQLRNLQLPSSIDEDIRELNDSIPSFDEVKTALNDIIRIPFKKVKELINETLDTYEFDRSTFPVPQKEQLTFCSDNNGINDFFDDLTDITHVARKIFLGVLLTLAILACAPMAWREIQRWKRERERSKLVQSNASDPMDVVYMVSRPYTSTIGLKISSKFRSIHNQVLVRWSVAYATSPQALFVLSLGIAGLFACICQYILLKSLEKEVPGLSDQVGAFAEKVVFSVNNASEFWANGTNAAIIQTNRDINNDVFGWVNESTTAVNRTLNEFVNKMDAALDTAFGDTVLREPIQDVLNCLILMKVQGIQKGLTWVKNHAHIDFPLMKNDTFTLGAAAQLTDSTSDDAFFSNPSDNARDEVTDAITSLIGHIASGIRTEAIISTCILLIWLFIALIGIVRASWGLNRGKLRAEGGQEYHADPQTEMNRGHDSFFGAPPTYEYNPPTSTSREGASLPPLGASTQAEPESTNEKIGHTGAREVGVAYTEPHHVRQSSHGRIDRTSPTEKKNNPFVTPFDDSNRF